MNMYQHIRDAVDEKKVLLEWHPQPGQEEPPVPLLKEHQVLLLFFPALVLLRSCLDLFYLSFTLYLHIAFLMQL